MQHILVIEDDPAVLHMLKSVLEFGCFVDEAATTGAEGLEKFAVGRFDAMLIDLTLPDMDGRDVIRAIRARSDIPILVISGLAGEDARVDALDAGADDFIAKPFLPRELLARIRAAIRRAPQRGRKFAAAFRFNPERPFVETGRAEVPLSVVEHKFLGLLGRNPGETISNREACEAIWGEYSMRTRKGLYVVANRLRKKIEADPSRPVHLIAHRGIGYRLMPESDD